MDQFLKIWSKNKKIIMSMSSNILELVIYERKKFSKKVIAGGFTTGATYFAVKK
jgi:hypothetical protein